MASTTSTPTSVGGGARPWRTALLTLRDESVASPSPPALLALLRRLLLSPASPSLVASAAVLSPHEVVPALSLSSHMFRLVRLGLTRSCARLQVGSDVVFLAEKAATVPPCAGADDVLPGVCHLVMILSFHAIGISHYTLSFANACFRFWAVKC
jgi:hypothetical protein